MNRPEFSPFELMLMKSKNEIGTAVLLLLSWIAFIDGEIDQSEAKQLAEISEASQHGSDVSQLIDIVQNSDLDALQLACEIIKNHFVGEKSALFLEMAIGIAIADGYLLPSENYSIRFIADLLDIPPETLNRLFIEITGREIPVPTDPSKASFWEDESGSQEDTSKGDSEGYESAHDETHSRQTNQEKINAYATIGLEVGASKEEIKSTYRRLAKIHHPDRFVSLGREAVAAATITFQRIQDAYDYLVKYE